MEEFEKEDEDDYNLDENQNSTKKKFKANIIGEDNLKYVSQLMGEIDVIKAINSFIGN